MRERERLRIRKEILLLPESKWTDDFVMRSVRLTNVQRENDRATRAMRELTCQQAKEWPELQSGARIFSHWQHEHRKPWTEDQLEMAGLFLFNSALWRAFGTAEFALARGFVKGWSAKEQARTLEVARTLWQNNIAVFTEAYHPARGRHRMEVSRRAPQDVKSVMQVFESVLKAVAPIWEQRKDIVLKAFHTASWKATTQRLMKIHGYGGTGFLAKEVVQDLLQTPIFQDYHAVPERWVSVCVDENEWCAVGPGARRGLNRLRGRPVKRGILDCSPAVEQDFLAELKELFERRKEEGFWPKMLLDMNVQELTLHDIQFQLCEFDKYQRAKYQEGRVRHYKAPTVRRLTREELEILVLESVSDARF